MKRVTLMLVGVLAICFLLGSTLCSGLIVGFYTGRWWGEWEINYLMDIPAGGVVMSPRTGAQWIKVGGNALRFVRIPDPRAARIVPLFPQGAKAQQPAKEEKDKKSEKLEGATNKGGSKK